MRMGNDLIYHKTAYDYDELCKVLSFVGFRDFKKYNWQETEHCNIDDHSQAYLPHMNKESGALISLNVECIK